MRIVICFCEYGGASEYRLVAGTEITGNSRVIDYLNPLWLPKPKSFKQVEARSDYSSIFSVESNFIFRLVDGLGWDIDF